MAISIFPFGLHWIGQLVCSYTKIKIHTIWPIVYISVHQSYPSCLSLKYISRLRPFFHWPITYIFKLQCIFRPHRPSNCKNMKFLAKISSVVSATQKINTLQRRNSSVLTMSLKFFSWLFELLENSEEMTSH